MLARVAPWLAIVLLTCACGAREPEPRSAGTGKAEAWSGELSPRPSPEAVVVAEVNGEPIWDVDLSRHAQARRLSPAAALDELVELTLLAQEAYRRGLAADPEVAEARKQARVRALMRLEFEPTFRSPDDVPQAEIDSAWKLQRVYMHFNHETHYQVRYVRVPLKKDASPDAIAAARQHAEALHATLTAARPEDQDAFVLLAQETAQTLGVKINVDRHGASKSGTTKEFYAAASALASPGDISPVTRTPWGFDILYLYELIPEARHTKEEATPEMRREFFEDSRQRAFVRWSDTFLETATITRRDELLQADLAQAGEASPRTPAPEAPKRP